MKIEGILSFKLAFGPTPFYYVDRQQEGVILSHPTVYSRMERKRATQLATDPVHLTEAIYTYNTANVRMRGLGYDHTDELIPFQIFLDDQT